MVVAEGSCPDLWTAMQETTNYAHQYSLDGPITVKIYPEKKKVSR
jgi:hypothetical protein